MMTKAPCKECSNRYPGCHARCENYLAWQREHIETLRELKRQANPTHIGYAMEQRSKRLHNESRKA